MSSRHSCRRERNRAERRQTQRPRPQQRAILTALHAQTRPAPLPAPFHFLPRNPNFVELARDREGVTRDLLREFPPEDLVASGLFEATASGVSLTTAIQPGTVMHIEHDAVGFPVRLQLERTFLGGHQGSTAATNMARWPVDYFPRIFIAACRDLQVLDCFGYWGMTTPQLLGDFRAFLRFQEFVDRRNLRLPPLTLVDWHMADLCTEPAISEFDAALARLADLAHGLDVNLTTINVVSWRPPDDTMARLRRAAEHADYGLVKTLLRRSLHEDSAPALPRYEQQRVLPTDLKSAVQQLQDDDLRHRQLGWSDACASQHEVVRRQLAALTEERFLAAAQGARRPELAALYIELARVSRELNDTHQFLPADDQGSAARQRHDELLAQFFKLLAALEKHSRHRKPS